MELAGYIAAIAIGVALGLVGGGGSILTVPVLLYFFGVEIVSATAYSLFIVGVTSFISSYVYFKKRMVNIRAAIVFGLPSLVGVFLTRKYLVSMIPDQLFMWDTFVLTKDLFVLVLFALLMVFASYSMIFSGEHKSEEIDVQVVKFNYPLIVIEGLAVGGLTGLVGAGGGFLIIPALMLLSKLPMKEAVGTSLVIIGIKSLIGFLGEPTLTTLDWNLLLSVTSLAIVGSIIGFVLSDKMDGTKLKKAFGYFVLVMGFFILAKELIF